MTATTIDYTTSEGLRALLIRLALTEDGWRTDPNASRLLEHTAAKYAALARRYDQSPADAAAAAFEVLRAPATLEAQDPWGVVTRAVQLTLQAEHRASRLLCSPSAARRLLKSPIRDVASLDDLLHHPTPEPVTPTTRGPGNVSHTEVRVALDNTVALLVALGWPGSVAQLGVEYICNRLVASGNPTTAFEYLRRDLTPLSLLDIDRTSWLTLARVLLGPDRPTLGGLVRRLLAGQTVTDLLADDAVVAPLLGARPTWAVGA